MHATWGWTLGADFQAATAELCGGAASGLNETGVGAREVRVFGTAADDSEGVHSVC